MWNISYFRSIVYFITMYDPLSDNLHSDHDKITDQQLVCVCVCEREKNRISQNLFGWHRYLCMLSSFLLNLWRKQRNVSLINLDLSRSDSCLGISEGEPTF